MWRMSGKEASCFSLGVRLPERHVASNVVRIPVEDVGRYETHAGNNGVESSLADDSLVADSLAEVVHIVQIGILEDILAETGSPGTAGWARHGTVGHCASVGSDPDRCRCRVGNPKGGCPAAVEPGIRTACLRSAFLR